MTDKVVVHRIMTSYSDCLRIFILRLNDTNEKVTLYRTLELSQVSKSQLKLSAVVDKPDSDLTVVKKACEGLAALIEDRELATYTELKANVDEAVGDQFSVSSGGAVIVDRERTAMARLQRVITLAEGAKVRLDGKERELAKVKGEWEIAKRELGNARKLMRKAHEELGMAVSVN